MLQTLANMTKTRVVLSKINKMKQYKKKKAKTIKPANLISSRSVESNGEDRLEQIRQICSKKP